MDKGFTWFALNNSTTNYIDLSRKLANSIKKHNKHNQVCVITDKPVKHTEFDHVVVLKENYSEQQEWKRRRGQGRRCWRVEGRGRQPEEY